MMKKTEYIGCCVSLPAGFIHELVDNMRYIQYTTVVRHVSCEQLSDAFPQYDWKGRKGNGLRLEDDFAVQFGTSTVKGRKYYVVIHSSIEYIWRV